MAEDGAPSIIRPNEEQLAQLSRLKFEEQNCPELFSKQFTSNEILHAAHSIRHSAEEGVPIKEIRKAHAAFAAQFPVIFENCCKTNFPLTFLPVLIHNFRSRLEGSLSEEEATDNVCQALNEKYADPILKNLHQPTKK